MRLTTGQSPSQIGTPVSQSGDRGTEGGRIELGWTQPTWTCTNPTASTAYTRARLALRRERRFTRTTHTAAAQERQCGERTTHKMSGPLASPPHARDGTHKRLGGRGAAWSHDRSALLTHTHKRRSHSVLSTRPTRVPPPSNGHRRPTRAGTSTFSRQRHQKQMHKSRNR